MTEFSNGRILLSPPECAELLGYSERKLWSMTAPRGPIKCVREGRSVRYSRRAIEQFIEAREAECAAA
jgi:predicted DNA-binding transcriptional regulator AlpA